MSFIDLCSKRQSCRKFSNRPVDKETLLSCVEAARLAPSGCNAQPWSFAIVTEPTKREEVAASVQHFGLNAGMVDAKAFVVVMEEHATLIPRLRCVFDSQIYAPGDLGAAAAYLCLQAADVGLGSCMLGVFDRERILKALDLPLTKRIAYVIGLGYPANDEVRPKARKPLESIVTIVE